MWILFEEKRHIYFFNCFPSIHRKSSSEVNRLKKKDKFKPIIILSVLHSPLLLLEDAALEDFEGISRNAEEINAVVVGLAPSKFEYESMNHAFRWVLLSYLKGFFI